MLTNSQLRRATIDLPITHNIHFMSTLACLIKFLSLFTWGMLMPATAATSAEGVFGSSPSSSSALYRALGPPRLLTLGI